MALGEALRAPPLFDCALPWVLAAAPRRLAGPGLILGLQPALPCGLRVRCRPAAPCTACKAPCPNDHSIYTVPVWLLGQPFCFPYSFPTVSFLPGLERPVSLRRQGMRLFAWLPTPAQLASFFLPWPSAAGKTVVAEYAIAKSFAQDKRVVYTSPLKASRAGQHRRK